MLTEKLRTVSSAVDKLDKSLWEEICREITEKKTSTPPSPTRSARTLTSKAAVTYSQSSTRTKPSPQTPPLRRAQRHDATLRLPRYIRRAGQDIIGHEPSARVGTTPAWKTRRAGGTSKISTSLSRLITLQSYDCVSLIFQLLLHHLPTCNGMNT